MANDNAKKLQTDFLGVKLSSPFIVGSGPISYGAAGIIRANEAGAGAVVTKTIRDKPAENPYPHIAINDKKSLINAEKWADIAGEQWVKNEIPRAVDKGAVVIASIGHTPGEVNNWAAKTVKAGAKMIELVSYREKDMAEMLRIAQKEVEVPIIVKISPNWNQPAKTAIDLLQKGADAVTVMDSIGPALRVDIRTGRPLVAGAQGEGWLTGEAIRPIAQAIIAEIRRTQQEPIIGLGGVMNSAQAIEMMMVGADLVGVCSTLIINGVEYLKKLNPNLIDKLAELGFQDLSEVSGYSQKYLDDRENKDKISFCFEADKCIDCQKCVQVCSYKARELLDKTMYLNENKCRYCGCCSSVCPTEALRYE